MLTVENASKTYPSATGLLRFVVQTANRSPVEALRDITFDVERGQIVGIVGPNGAGKSTLLRLCATLLEPTSGRVSVDGVDLARDPRAARGKIGLFLNDDRAIYWRLNGRENLRFFGVMAGLEPAIAARRADELLEEFDLAARDRRTFGYSSGMLVRLGLARALIAGAPLIILDEPSRSLDPIASKDLEDRLHRLAASGTAIVLSNHRLDEIQDTCDRVLVLTDGRQEAWVSMDELAAPGRRPAEVLRDMLTVEHGP